MQKMLLSSQASFDSRYCRSSQHRYNFICPLPVTLNWPKHRCPIGNEFGSLKALLRIEKLRHTPLFTIPTEIVAT